MRTRCYGQLCQDFYAGARELQTCIYSLHLLCRSWKCEHRGDWDPGGGPRHVISELSLSVMPMGVSDRRRCCMEDRAAHCSAAAGAQPA